jgi:hypothetical protein
MEDTIMSETTNHVVGLSPRLAKTVALFAGISGVLILALSLPVLLQRPPQQNSWVNSGSGRAPSV